MKKIMFKNVVENLEFVFNEFAERPALYIDKKEISYKQLKEKVDIALNVFLKKRI